VTAGLTLAVTLAVVCLSVSFHDLPLVLSHWKQDIGGRGELTCMVF
jgi:hypothetical protein